MDGSVYDDIGVRRVINASGSMTYIGGSLMASEVLEKMSQAAGAFVFIEELLAWASGEIAALTGTESGLVTTGTAGGILLSTAACLTGMDRKRMRALPSTDGWKNEVVMQKHHRIGFDHAVGVAGGVIVEVGERDSGTTLDHIEAALCDRTAAVLHVAIDPTPTVPLPEVAELAHSHGIPVIVDAAAELPPVSNLSAFAESGGDLVIFSGGKEISGPNDSGILCGNADLVAAATAQAFPNGGIGRPLKVGKEQIVGLVFALKRFANLDWESRMARWQRMAERMVAILAGIDGATVDVALAERGGRPLCIPRTRVRIDEAVVGHTVKELDELLEQGTPAIAVGPDAAFKEIWLNPQHLEDGEEEIAALRLRGLLEAAGDRRAENGR